MQNICSNSDCRTPSWPGLQRRGAARKLSDGGSLSVISPRNCNPQRHWVKETHPRPGVSVTMETSSFRAAWASGSHHWLDWHDCLVADEADLERLRRQLSAQSPRPLGPVSAERKEDSSSLPSPR